MANRWICTSGTEATTYANNEQKKMATITAVATAATAAATTLVRRMLQAGLNVPCDTQSPIYNNINKPAGRNGNAPSLQIVSFSFTTLQPYRELPMFGVHVFVQAHFFLLRCIHFNTFNPATCFVTQKYLQTHSTFRVVQIDAALSQSSYIPTQTQTHTHTQTQMST